MHTHHDRHARKTKQKTKRQRGFPACSQASTNAPQAGLSSLFRWGRLIFCWYERLMEDSARRVSMTMMTCIGRDTLMGHFCTYTPWTRHRHEPVYKPSRAHDGWMTRRGVLFFCFPPRIDTTRHTTSYSTYRTSDMYSYCLLYTSPSPRDRG